MIVCIAVGMVIGRLLGEVFFDSDWTSLQEMAFGRGANFGVWYEWRCDSPPSIAIQDKTARAIYREGLVLSSEYLKSLCPPKPPVEEQTTPHDPANIGQFDGSRLVSFERGPTNIGQFNDSSRVTLAEDSASDDAMTDTISIVSMTYPTIDLADWVDADLLKSASASPAILTWDLPLIVQILREVRALRQSCLLSPMPGELGVKE